MKTYSRWIKKFGKDFSNKNVVVLGATGSLGKEICDILSSLNANIYISVRNKNKGEELIKELKKKYPFIKYEILLVDLSSSKSTIEYAYLLKQIHIDYFINCAGVYHLNQRFVENDLEIHFATNYYNQVLLLKEIEEYIRLCKGKTIVLGSISQRFYSLDFNDFMSIKTKNKTKVYARSKKIFVIHTLNMIKNGSNITICHPGISPTTLFSSTKGGFSKTFEKIIVPIMKLIFISPRKAALNILYSMTHDIEYPYQVGPRGLLHIWGYPKKYKFNKYVLNENNQKRVIDIYNSILKG